MTSIVEQDFETLPVVAFKDEILGAVKRSQIVICIGETGSGKTTQIPQFFADENLLNGKQIAVTQPRRIAAITVAQRVSDERRKHLGDEVGYTVRFDDKTTARTKIKFMTDGILVRECLSDKSLSNYSIIMLDEAHERSLNTDILFGLLKQACKLRPDLKLIVTSATLNTDKFGPYFLGCPIIHVPGRVFPVDIYHSKTKQVMTASGPSNSSYVQAAVDVILKIHKKDEEGHILVFLTGQEEIEKACSLLRAAMKSESSPDRELIVLPLYAALTSEQQAKVFKHPKFLLENDRKVREDHMGSSGEVKTEGKLLRKCVIATNIAETSITVPQVRFVVDAGYVKQKAYDPSRGMESLVIVPSSKIASLQRAGRAGRTGPGQCYRLYSSECFDHMMEETVPEIQRINLANTVLYLKALGIHDILGFDFLDPPSVDQIMEALSQLHTLQAIDHSGYITALGRQMSSFPLEPNLARMLIESNTSECDCLEEITTICAMLSAENIWVTPPPPSKEARFAQLKQQQAGAVFGESRLQMNFKGAYGGGSSGFGGNGGGGYQNNSRGSSSGGTGGSQFGSNFSSEEGERAKAAHAALSHPYGDFHTYLHVYNTWEAQGRSVKWCERNFVNFRSMKTVGSIREHLARDAAKVLNRHNGASSSYNSNQPHRRQDHDSRDCKGDRDYKYSGGSRGSRDYSDNNKGDHPDKVATTAAQPAGEEVIPLEQRICSAITAGFFMNSGVLCAHGNVFKYMSLLDLERQRSKQEAIDVRMVHIHPTSALANDGGECPHNYVVYQALVHSTKLFMKQIARADAKLLKRLQREWRYVDPYVLCGRQHERVQDLKASTTSSSSSSSASSAAVAIFAATTASTTPGTATARSSSGGGAITDTVISSTSAGSDKCNSVPGDSVANNQGSLAGNKRPLSPTTTSAAQDNLRTSGGAVCSSISSSSSGSSSGGVAPNAQNAAADAAKQRYMERMAAQKARMK